MFSVYYRNTHTAAEVMFILFQALYSLSSEVSIVVYIERAVYLWYFIVFVLFSGMKKRFCVFCYQCFLFVSLPQAFSGAFIGIAYVCCCKVLMHIHVYVYSDISFFFSLSQISFHTLLAIKIGIVWFMFAISASQLSIIRLHNNRIGTVVSNMSIELNGWRSSITCVDILGECPL